MDMEEDENIDKKECLFSFSKLNKYYLIPFLCPIICFLSNYMMFNLKISLSSSNIAKEYVGHKKNDFLYNIIIVFSYTTAGLLFFITKLRIKTKKTENKNSINNRISSSSSIELIYNSGYDNLTANYSQLKIFFLLFLEIILVCLTIIILNYIPEDAELFEKRFYYFIFISLFSRIILKENIYIHQKVSLALSSFGFIFMAIPFFKVFDLKRDLLYNIIYLFHSVFYSLFVVIIRLLTQHYYLSPYKILLIVGIGSLIILSIYQIIYSLIVSKDLSILINDFNFSNIEKNIYLFILFIVLLIVFGFFLQTFIFFIIYYFSPTLFALSDIISPILSYYIVTIRYKEGEGTLFNILFKSIGYSIVLICALFYNEIIICNFCGLNENTKQKILDRQDIEISSLNIE